MEVQAKYLIWTEYLKDKTIEDWSMGYFSPLPEHIILRIFYAACYHHVVFINKKFLAISTSPQNIILHPRAQVLLPQFQDRVPKSMTVEGKYAILKMIRFKEKTPYIDIKDPPHQIYPDYKYSDGWRITKEIPYSYHIHAISNANGMTIHCPRKARCTIKRIKFSIPYSRNEYIRKRYLNWIKKGLIPIPCDLPKEEYIKVFSYLKPMAA